jgi:hypothetical protein
MFSRGRRPELQTAAPDFVKKKAFHLYARAQIAEGSPLLHTFNALRPEAGNVR